MQTIDELISAKEEARDQTWEKNFLSAFLGGHVELLADTPQNGPEGFPYLFVKTSSTGEPVHQVLHWLSTRGIGLVVNPQKGYPDYVFTYGMVWNYLERKNVAIELPKTKSARFELQKDKPLFHGEPSKEFFPEYARKILKDFLFEQGVIKPKFLALSQDNSHFDICFSIESLGKPEKKELAGIAEAIAWFFPQNASIVLVEEVGLPKFFDL